MSKPRPPGRTPLARRLLATYALAYVVLIGLMALIVDRSTQNALLDELTVSLETDANLAVESMPTDPDELQAWAATMFEVGGFRTTVIDTDGVVMADSHSDPAVMENHSDRPEVVTALAGETGTATRVSASTGFKQLYVAVPPDDGRIVRVSVPTRVIDDRLNSVRYSVIGVAVVVGLLGVAVVAFIAGRLARPISQLTEQSRSIASGNLAVEPHRSDVRELDQLALAITAMAGDLGKRVTEAEQATEYLEVVLGALPQGAVLIDGNRITYANPSAHQLLGSIPDDLGGLTPFQCQTIVREARETGETVDDVVDHGQPPRRLHAVATPFADQDRTLLNVVDITDTERVAEVRRDFVANASHELKTPVATIIASSEALQIAVGRGDENALVFANQIEKSAYQLDRLVTDLLDLSRLEKESPDMTPVRFDLLARDEVDRIRSHADKKGISVSAHYEPISIRGSHRDLAIAVRNLLDNAATYTGEHGAIDVTLLSDGAEAILRVGDTGEGIPTRDLDRVFERFYRVDSARSRATGGTGLGLAIVKHVAHSHGGSVEADSELGVGTTFTLRLPLLTEG